MSVPRKHVLPDPASVQRTFATLFERTVRVNVSNVARVSSLAIAAAYAFDSGDIGGVVQCDLPLAAATGAAIALLPATRVREVIKAGALDEALRANFREVANVLASSLIEIAARHMRLRQIVYGPSEILPVDASDVVAHGRYRVDLDVGITGYGAGCMAFVVP
jgi:hypothetical protein